MKLRLTPRAQREATKERCEWRRRRDYVDIFDDELAEVLRFILRSPKAARRAQRKGRECIYCLRMPKTQLHVYYRIDAAEVVVVHVWPMRKHRRPKL